MLSVWGARKGKSGDPYRRYQFADRLSTWEEGKNLKIKVKDSQVDTGKKKKENFIGIHSSYLKVFYGLFLCLGNHNLKCPFSPYSRRTKKHIFSLIYLL